MDLGEGMYVSLPTPPYTEDQYGRSYLLPQLPADLEQDEHHQQEIQPYRKIISTLANGHSLLQICNDYLSNIKKHIVVYESILSISIKPYVTLIE